MRTISVTDPLPFNQAIDRIFKITGGRPVIVDEYGYVRDIDPTDPKYDPWFYFEVTGAGYVNFLVPERFITNFEGVIPVTLVGWLCRHTGPGTMLLVCTREVCDDYPTFSESDRNRLLEYIGVSTRNSIGRVADS